MKHSKIIRKAKKIIDTTGKDFFNQFVCCAIQDAAKSCKDMDRADEITALIRKRLKGCDTVTAWLFSNKSISTYDVPYQQIQDYRLRWMDSLIEEYERVGK